jgi:hypothetical protein
MAISSVLTLFAVIPFIIAIQRAGQRSGSSDVTPSLIIAIIVLAIFIAFVFKVPSLIDLFRFYF